MTTDLICTASGKESLGGGTFVGITVTMVNGWRVGFEARGTPTAVQVSGGNLVAESGIVGDQFFQTSNIQIQYQSSSSATLQGAQTLENLEHAVESLNVSHAGGEIYFWNPVDGDDLNDGSSETSSVKTFARAHDLCADGNNDVIYCITGLSSQYLINERITITKSSLHLRGKGRKHVFAPTTSGDTITILDADDVEINGFEVRTHNIGNNNAVDLHGLRSVLKDIFITSFTGKGVFIHDCVNCKLSDIKIQYGTGSGAEDAGFYAHNSKDFILERCEIISNASNGMKLKADNPNDTDHCTLRNVSIYGNSGYQLNVENSNVSNLLIDEDCYISNEGLGRILDNGTNTHDLEMVHKIENISVRSGRSLDR